MARKPKKEDPPADTRRWLGTYGDMVTLLMAFFVMLFAVSDANPVKFESFVQGLAGPFNNPSVELGLLEDQGVQQSNDNPIEMLAPTQPGRADISSATIEGGGALTDMEASEDGRGAEAAAQLAQVESQIELALQDIQLPISADVRDSERGLVVAISTDDVLFETGSAVLSEAGRTLIAELAPVLVNAPNTIVVEGHTDDVPLNRGGYTNWNLSTDRAIAVVELLGGGHGLPWTRMSATGYGEHRPLRPNDSAADRAINRRVEILVVALDVAAAGEPAPPPGPAVLDFSELPPASPGTTIAGVLGGS